MHGLEKMAIIVLYELSMNYYIYHEQPHNNRKEVRMTACGFETTRHVSVQKILGR